MPPPFDTRPIVITGASGFLGSALRRLLAQLEIPVLALSRHPRADSPAARWIQGDLGAAADITRWLPENAVIFHLGASLTGSPEAVHDSIVAGTRRLVEAARTRGGRVVHASSLAVIDPEMSHAVGVVSETSPVDAQPALRGSYSHAKILADALVRADATSGGDNVVVRPAQLVGNGLAAVPASVAVRRAGRLLMLAAPNWGVPVVHVADAATGLLMAANAASGAIFHLVDDNSVRRDALLSAMRRAEIPGSDLPVVQLHRLVALAQHLPGGTGRRLLALDTRARYASAAAHAHGWQPVALSNWLSAGRDP